MCIHCLVKLDLPTSSREIARRRQCTCDVLDLLALSASPVLASTEFILASKIFCLRSFIFSSIIGEMTGDGVGEGSACEHHASELGVPGQGMLMGNGQFYNVWAYSKLTGCSWVHRRIKIYLDDFKLGSQRGDSILGYDRRLLWCLESIGELVWKS